MQDKYTKFREGHTLRIKDHNKNPDHEIQRMIDNGVLLIINKTAVINPLLYNVNSYSLAVKKLKNIYESWLNNIDESEAVKLRYRLDQMDWFKANPCEVRTIGNRRLAYLPEDTPSEFRKGSGKAYIMQNEIISLHFGNSIPDKYIPVGCEIVKCDVKDGVILLNV